MTAHNHKKKILKERANILKQPLRKKNISGTIIKGLEFLLSDQRYAIDTVYVSEVILINEMTPLPCTPEFVLGIINLRGNILSVIDIKRFFNIPTKGITNLNRVIVLKHDDLELCIIVDDIVGDLDIELEKLKTNVTALTKGNENFIIGVTEDRLIVLDIKELLLYEKLIVNEEI